MGRGVAHITSVHRWDDHRILHKQCCSLVGAGYEVALWCVGPASAEFEETGVHVHVLAGRSSRLGRMLLTAPRLLVAARKSEPSLMHVHDPELLPWALLLKGRKTRLVYDVHEDVPAQVLSKHWIPRALRKPLSTLVGLIEGCLARRPDAVILATPLIVARYPRKSIVVQNFPRLDEFRQSVKPTAPRYFAYVGGISQARGAIEMLDALALARSSVDIRLLLAGPMQPCSLIDELCVHPAWPSVEYRPWMSRHEIADALAGAVGGLVTLHPEPNYVGAYPVKMFEYMASGLPIIASDFPLWRAILEDCGTGLLVNPRSASDIAEAMVRLVKDETFRTSSQTKGVECVESRYSWDSEFRKLETKYRALITAH